MEYITHCKDCPLTARMHSFFYLMIRTYGIEDVRKYRYHYQRRAEHEVPHDNSRTHYKTFCKTWKEVVESKKVQKMEEKDKCAQEEIFKLKEELKELRSFHKHMSDSFKMFPRK